MLKVARIVFDINSLNSQSDKFNLKLFIANFLAEFDATNAFYALSTVKLIFKPPSISDDGNNLLLNAAIIEGIIKAKL